jgi:hypothetical protein
VNKHPPHAYVTYIRNACTKPSSHAFKYFTIELKYTTAFCSFIHRFWKTLESSSHVRGAVRCGAVRCGREGYDPRTATNLDTVSTTERFKKTAIAM